jgi:type IV pilus assembly protein PilC
MTDTYAYKGRDLAGKVVSGTLVADNPQLVVSRLREMGYTPISVDVKTQGMGRELHILPARVKLKDLAVFSRQFATMVNAGLPILRALSILETQSESKKLRETTAEVRVDIERGSSLSAAMQKHPKVFSKLYVAMVKSGETGGVLDQVLVRLADNLEREVSLRHRIRSAMTYPIVVLGFVTLILAAMLIFIVPQFKSIYAQLGGSLPLPTKLLLTVSDAVKHFWYIVIAATVALVFVIRRVKRTPQGQATWDRLKLRIPIFGSLFQKSALARFSRVLGVLNRSGVPILQSLEVVSDTVNNSLMSAAIIDVQNAVKQGESLAKPLGEHSVFPPMVVQMLTVGEETGALDTMLEKVAQFYDDEVTAAVDSLTSIIEPLMIFVVGGAVGLSVIALYLPMFNIINLIK